MNLEIISWNETLSRVYRKLFMIYAERLGDSLHIDGNEITIEDFNFPAEIRSNGNIEVSNSDMATQKALTRFQVISNPALQDIVNSEDKYNALKDWLEKDGIKDPDQFCTDPKKIAKEVIGQMQAQIKQMGAQLQQMQKQAQSGAGKQVSESISFKDLPPEGQAQMAAQAGIIIRPETIANNENDKLLVQKKMNPFQPKPGQSAQQPVGAAA